MFERLFAQSGLSLDRLKALVEVAAAGSIVRAAGEDPVRQSQYSRQIKELEDFFQAGLVERHGKGIRVTAAGRELARISRFFLMGLGNFQRGCLAEGQSYRMGASRTFVSEFLLPAVAQATRSQAPVRFDLMAVTGDEVERKLHDLTLDFGVVHHAGLTRPLKAERIGSWNLQLWVPLKLCRTAKQAITALKNKDLPLAWASGEPGLPDPRDLVKPEPALTCDSLLDARQALETEAVGTVLPAFLQPGKPERFLKMDVPLPKVAPFEYFLAWNPRLLRLNPHAARRKDTLLKALRDAAGMR
jgi:DNA-binding transcriptional LysR family regulator